MPRSIPEFVNRTNTPVRGIVDDDSSPCAEEAGKGFAFVAVVVRNPALRSTDAARSMSEPILRASNHTCSWASPATRSGRVSGTARRGASSGSGLR